MLSHQSLQNPLSKVTCIIRKAYTKDSQISGRIRIKYSHWTPTSGISYSVYLEGAHEFTSSQVIFPGDADGSDQGLHFENHCPRLWILTLHKNSSTGSQTLGARLVDCSSANAQVAKQSKISVPIWPSSFSCH